MFDFNFLPEYGELLMYAGIAELAVHHLENGLEFIIELRLLNISINDLQVDMLREKIDRIFDLYRQEPIPFFLDLLRICCALVDLIQLFFNLLELLFLR